MNDQALELTYSAFKMEITFFSSSTTFGLNMAWVFVSSAYNSMFSFSGEYAVDTHAYIRIYFIASGNYQLHAFTLNFC